MHANAVPEPSERPGHIKRRPNRNAIAQVFRNNSSVVREVSGQIAIGPAAAVFQRLRQVPMVHGAERAYPGFQHRVDKTTVMVETLLVYCSAASRLNARPGNGKTVAL